MNRRQNTATGVKQPISGHVHCSPAIGPNINSVQKRKDKSEQTVYMWHKMAEQC